MQQKGLTVAIMDEGGRDIINDMDENGDDSGFPVNESSRDVPAKYISDPVA